MNLSPGTDWGVPNVYNSVGELPDAIEEAINEQLVPNEEIRWRGYHKTRLDRFLKPNTVALVCTNKRIIRVRYVRTRIAKLESVDLKKVVGVEFSTLGKAKTSVTTLDDEKHEFVSHDPQGLHDAIQRSLYRD